MALYTVWFMTECPFKLYGTMIEIDPPNRKQ